MLRRDAAINFLVKLQKANGIALDGEVFVDRITGSFKIQRDDVVGLKCVACLSITSGCC